MRRPNPGPEDSRYQEVTEEIHRLSRYESFAIGRLLCQVRDERIFGHWGTFEDYVEWRAPH